MQLKESVTIPKVVCRPSTSKYKSLLSLQIKHNLHNLQLYLSDKIKLKISELYNNYH